MAEMKIGQGLSKPQHAFGCRRKAKELHRGLDHGDNPCGTVEYGKIGDQEFGTKMLPQN